MTTGTSEAQFPTSRENKIRIERATDALLSNSFPLVRKAAFLSIEGINEVGYKALLEEILSGRTGVFYVYKGKDPVAIMIAGLSLDRYSQTQVLNVKAFMSIGHMSHIDWKNVFDGILFLAELLRAKKVVTSLMNERHVKALSRLGARRSSIMEADV